MTNSGQFKQKTHCIRGHDLTKTRYVHPTNKQWTYCKECQKLAYNTYHGKTKDKFKHLKRTYGITRDEYETMLIEQNGVCALCKKPPSPNWSLCVDHNHISGTVRGLLCHSCNSGLGLLKEDTTLLLHVIEYLKRSPIKT